MNNVKLWRITNIRVCLGKLFKFFIRLLQNQYIPNILVILNISFFMNNCINLFADNIYPWRNMWLKIILAFFVYNTIKSKRLVINTTCLELSDPSNQKFRLSCVNSSDYHCLLDRDSINEYEVCRKWKWIAAGKSRQLLLSNAHEPF